MELYRDLFSEWRKGAITPTAEATQLIMRCSKTLGGSGKNYLPCKGVEYTSTIQDSLEMSNRKSSIINFNFR